MPVRPQVTQCYAKGDIKRTMSLTYGVSKISSAIILMLSIPASLEIDYLLHIWLGDNVPEHTAMFTVLILITSLVNNLNAAISSVVHATGVMKQYQLWGSLVRVCSVPIAFCLIKEYDVPELGLCAVLFTATITHIVCLFIARKLVQYSLREYTVNVILPILAVLIIGIVLLIPIHLLMQEGVLRFLLVCFASVFVVGFSVYYIAFNSNERKLSLQLLNPIISHFRRNH